MRHWLFDRVNHVFFPDDFDDLKNDRYTQGYSDGTIFGVQRERTSHERMKELYETPKDTVFTLIDHVKKALEDMLSPIDTNLIATFSEAQKRIYVGGKEVDPGRLQNLKSEAEFLLNTDLWHVIQETPKALAEKAMFVSGDDIAFMQKGRSMLYTLSTQKRIVDLFASARTDPKPSQPTYTQSGSEM